MCPGTNWTIYPQVQEVSFSQGWTLWPTVRQIRCSTVITTSLNVLRAIKIELAEGSTVLNALTCDVEDLPKIVDHC
jgi:hypothetical protein